jgi:hypothetical protein
MKRPVELTVALVILAVEYLTVLPGYVASFVEGVKGGTTGPATTFVVSSFFWFITLRPLVLYLLWRGTSWMRTWIIWVLPISFLFFFLRGLMLGASQSMSSSAAPDVMLKLSGPDLLTRAALTVGLFALLVLYLPRVRTWFKLMKETRAAARVANDT